MTGVSDLSAIVELFNNAAKHGKRKKLPKIHFADFVLYQAGSRSRYAGAVYIAAPGYDAGWYARIETSGSLTLNESILRPSGLEDELQKFAANPVEYAARYGRESGNCCFCNIKITDPRSLNVGYGPVCAENYGLPWGEKAPLECQNQTLESELGQFIGSETLYRHGMFNILYTEGVQYLAEKTSCYWLLDAIGSWQIKSKVKSEPFQLWQLTVNADKEGVLTCRRDSNDAAIVTQRIESTDFPLPEIKFYLCDGVLMLPSEY